LTSLERIIRSAAHADRLIAAASAAAAAGSNGSQATSLASPQWAAQRRPTSSLPSLSQLQNQISSVANVDTLVAMMMNNGITVTAVFPVDPFPSSSASVNGGAVVKSVNLWFQTHKGKS
jgi:hypothetical protein